MKNSKVIQEKNPSPKSRMKAKRKEKSKATTKKKRSSIGALKENFKKE